MEDESHWCCAHCTFANEKKNTKCDVCDKKKTVQRIPKLKTQLSLKTQSYNPNFWRCNACTYESNPMNSSACEMCGGNQ